MGWLSADAAATVIVPRWEWRTFGASLAAAESHLSTLEPTRVEESDELYVLSTRVEGSIKVRDGRLDVKRLEEVNDDGLEQWNPVTKADFPVGADVVRALLLALDETVPPLGRESYGVEQLVTEVIDPHPDLSAIPVTKRRVHYVVDGCMAELTDVRAGTRSTRTVAVESADPAVVRETVHALGLWSRPNVSFPRGLALLVGLRTPRRAVIDVGTNSVKLVVGEQTADGSWRAVVDRSEVTRLGQGLADEGRLHPDAMQRTADAIAGMVDEARHHGAEQVAAVGTAWMRDAENSDELVAATHRRSGVRIEMIDGEEEARLSYLATIGALGAPDGSLVVFETGGGSTQFTFGRTDRVDEQFSVGVGAVGVTARFGLGEAVDEATLDATLDALAVDLAALDGRPAPDLLLGMGGALTNLAAVKHELVTYDPALVQGTVLDLGEIDRQIELYRTRSADGRRSIVGLQAKRADIILAGACIVRTVLSQLRSSSLVVSDRGLRHRLLVERFGGSKAAR